jgi:hypothetical protein
MLPILSLDTQKEKASVMKDVEDMLRKEIETNPNIGPVDVINIAMGINTHEKNPYYRYNFYNLAIPCGTNTIIMNITPFSK